MTDTLIRALIVDDEELGREALRARLTDMPDVELLGEAHEGRGAIDAILALRPDLVFLDVDMPGVDGLGVLESVAPEHLPMVVFVTAHEKYALRAFQYRALDYLLKPVTTKRLVEALTRARQRMSDEAELAEALRRLGDMLESRGGGSDEPPPAAPPAPLTRLVVREDQSYLLLPLDQVDSLEAAGNYVRIVTAQRTYLLRSTLTELERKLDPARFVRIHRSTIVQIDRVERITPHPNGDYEVILRGGRMVRMSRSYRNSLLP